MNIENLQKKLSNEIVSFKFTKKDGTIREAKGTTNKEIIEKDFGIEYLPKGTKEIKYSENVTRYFDVDKLGWRSFQNDSLIDE